MNRNSSQHPPEKRRVFILDDHAIVRKGLVELLNLESDLAVCGEAGDIETAYKQITETRPDLVLADLSLGDSLSLNLIENLVRTIPDLRVLVLSMLDEEIYAKRALKAGSKGYVMKSENIAEVRNAIRQVLDGKTYVSDRMIQALLSENGGRGGATDGISALSDRELEVFRRIGLGEATSKIADALGLSPRTVETYRERIKDKLGLADGAELVARAIAWSRAEERSGG